MAAARQNDPLATKTWSTVLEQCFVRRILPNEADDALLECHRTTRILGEQLASILLRTCPQPEGIVDPLLPQYLEHLLDAGFVDAADVLKALLSMSPYKPQSSQQSAEQATKDITKSNQETVFTTLSSNFTATGRRRTHAETARIFRALLSWVQAFNAYETVLQIDSVGSHTPETALVSSFEQLAVFLLILLNNNDCRKQLNRIIPKAAKANISSLLGHFATTLEQWSHAHISQKLRLMLKIPPLVDGAKDRVVNFTAADIALEITDLPRVVSRAGLYAYLNAALSARPLVDDLHLLSYLHARYAHDHQTMIGDLVVAAFDNLANALHQHESAHTILCHKSFITNKLHPLISGISVSQLLQPGLTEQYIQMALARIETHPFPPISSDTSGINDVLRDTRHDFVNACHLHHLISQAAALAVLGQAPLPPSTGTRHNKQVLFNQIIASAQKAEGVVGELDRMTGDAGPISNALVEALRHFANTKETRCLKTLSIALTRKLPFVDIILQHNRLSDIIVPLCLYLNEWSHDEDQSELQPAYDDFASILLFTLALIHRYDVSPTELDSFERDSFIVKLVTRMSTSRSMKDLDESETRILSQWIRGLFAVDEKGESIGISDETMSGCSPQAFYLLVPTLFEQIVYACRAKALNATTLKGGLEFLLEPFLLPSLIGGLNWLATHALTNTKDTEFALQIMNRLMKPSSVSGDAQMMHQTILGMLFRHLRQCLQDIDHRVPIKKETGQLISALKPFADSGYTIGGSVAEIREWTASSGNLKQAAADIVTQLTTWSTQSDLNPIPTKYTHRTVSVAVSSCGAEEVLQSIVEEVTSQTAFGFGSSALEVATSLICAPNLHNTFQVPSFLGSRPLSTPNQLTVYQVLKLQLADKEFLLRTEFAKTETLVRLGRLVDSQSVVTEVPLLASMPINIPPEDLMEGIDTAAAAAAVADVAAAAAVASAIDPVDQVVLDAATADFGLGDAGIDLTGSGGDLALGDSGGLGLDLSDGLFGGQGDVSFDLGLDGVTGDVSGQSQNQGQARADDDDIFAGIDLGMMDDDDFQF